MESIPHFFIEKDNETYLFIMQYDCHIKNILPEVNNFIGKSLPSSSVYYTDYYPSVSRYLNESLDYIIGKISNETLNNGLSYESLLYLSQITFIRYNVHEIFKCSAYVPDEYKRLLK